MNSKPFFDFLLRLVESGGGFDLYFEGEGSYPMIIDEHYGIENLESDVTNQGKIRAIQGVEDEEKFNPVNEGGDQCDPVGTASGD